MLTIAQTLRELDKFSMFPAKQKAEMQDVDGVF